MSKKVLITAALPYANGDSHLGHLLEYIQADFFSRYNKLIGNDTLYICASDMHGTPIEINAKKANLSPEKYADQFWKSHQKDFKSFLVEFDNFHKTNSKENKELVEWFFSESKKKSLIYTKEIEQMYDEQEKRFLPDRLIKGTCPKCKAEHQYGDVCEKCGATYNTADLIKPYSVLSKTTPVIKSSTHYFFKLSEFTSKLKLWIKNSNIQPEVKNSVKEWLTKGLKDWCISRDEPYFGFKIPNSKKETGAQKYFYVWLDAPIGYISSTKNYTDKHKQKWQDYWYHGQVHHFIGKDIVYFHYLFWPAILLALDIPLPQLTTHGFITVNGTKMSKSRGTFIKSKDFIKKYHPEALRFYYASHLDRKLVDIDLNLKHFQAVTNNVLMGNLGNFCYRTLTFANKNYDEISTVKKEKELEAKVTTLVQKTNHCYQEQDFKNAVKNILKIADIGNQYFQNAEPWKNKQDSQPQVGFCLNLARILAIISQPILPEFSKKVLTALGEKKCQWKNISFNWQGKVNKPELLVTKIETISEETFPLQMKVGKIINVQDHSNADSLYLLTVDFKEETRQVVAGLKKYFKPEQLLNLTTVFCTNLKPAKIRGEKSEAMIMIAEDKKLSFLETDAEIGSEITFKGLSNSNEEITFEQFLKINMKVKDKKIIYDNKEMLHITTNNNNDAKIR